MEYQSEITTYYNDLAKDYDNDRFNNTYGKFIDDQEHKFLNTFFDKSNNKEVLDIACGTGRFMRYATHGIDISDNMIKVSQLKYPNKKFSVTDGDHTGFENEVFDSVLSFHLFMHLTPQKTEKILTEAYRITKPQGKFILDIPSKKRRKFLRKQKEGWHGANDMSLKDIESICGGWEIEKSQGVLFLPIHRFPKQIRKAFLWLDNMLCKSFLKEYSSYLMIVLSKK
jgi:ubiquinone/menaquinone biosynthesis C-methylase UbiE